jgi:membrane protein DedA with SNARE-associated domain
MTFSLEWFSVIIASYPFLKYLVVFFGAAFGAETAIIPLSFLTGHGVFPLISFSIVTLAGTIFGDIVWYLLGRSKFAEKIIGHRYAAVPLSVIMEAVRRISRGNRLLALLFAKFLIGTRAIVTIYVSKTSISAKSFFPPDLAAIVIWLATIITIGYLSGLGFTYVSGLVQNIYVGIGFILLVIILIIIAQILIQRFFKKKEEEIIQEDKL